MAEQSTALAIATSPQNIFARAYRWLADRFSVEDDAPIVVLAASSPALVTTPQLDGTPRSPSMFGDRPHEYREIPVLAFTEWDRVGIIRAILRELEQGMFNRASLLSILQDRDDRLSGCWAIRTDTLLGTPLEFDPAEIDGYVTNETQAIADAAEVDWPKMFQEGALDRLFRAGRDLGFGLGELVTYEDEETGRWVPRLKNWHSQWVWWNWATDSYWLNTSGAVDEDGNPCLSGSGTIELPRIEREVYSDGHWVIYCPGGYRYAYLRGAIRATAMLHLKRQWDMRDWARYNEAYGLLVRKAFIPAGANVNDKTVFGYNIKNIGSEATIECPVAPDGSKFDLEITGAPTGSGSSTFGDSLRYVDECIGNVLLGQAASGEKKGGLGNGDSNQNEAVRQDVLEKDARLYHVLKLQVLSWWTLWNFGDKRLTPTPSPMIEPAEDLGRKSGTLKSVGEAAQAIKAAWPNADMEAIAAEHGIPLLPLVEGDETEPPPVDTALSIRALSGKAKRKRLYVDRLAETARDRAATIMRPQLMALKAVISESTGPDDLRSRLVTLYRGMDSRAMADLVEKCEIMAALEGRHDVLDKL